MMVFSKKYFVYACLLLLVEILIALYLHDRFIRPYFGDYLVVILLYCLLKSFVKMTPLKAAIYVLLFAYLIEISQYFNLVKVLGWENSRFARTVIGSSFGWEDMIAYTLGIATVLALERHKTTYRGDPARSKPGK